MADFEALYREHYRLVYQILLGLSRDPGLAEELAQETFFRAYINMAKLRSDGAAVVWLCTIARNLYFAWCREQKKRVPLEESVTAGPEEQTEAKLLTRQALAVLEGLEEPYRRVFSLHILGGLPPEADQRAVRKERELGPGDLPPGEAEDHGKDDVIWIVKWCGT